MNLSPDPRQLKTKVTLSIMNAPESGFFSGEYTATSATKSQDNLNVLNYDFETSYTYANGNTEAKYSRRLKVISSLQNARIPEVNTAISASSCTFAWGAIVPGEEDPVLNRLVGPTENYNPVFVDEPKQGAVTSFIDESIQQVPKIPFTNIGNKLKTYNIWHVVQQSGDNNYATTEAYKYIGPARTGVNTGTLRTVKDPVYGAQVEVTSIQTKTRVLRVFPISYDAVYQDGAQVHNPDGTVENILARGINGNNGFHFNFSASNMQQNTSKFVVTVSPGLTGNDNYINTIDISFEIDKKPVLRIYDPYSKDYIVQTDLIAPVLDKNTMNSYDIFVHFVGPNMLVGFSPDISKWNTIINVSGREVFFNPDTTIILDLSNCNIKFRYSALIFNNFNNDQPSGSTKNYITAEFKFSKSKISKIEPFLTTVKKSFEAASYRINDSPRNIGYNPQNPIDKNISYFADLRLPKFVGGKYYPQFSDFTPYQTPAGVSADNDRQTLYFKLIYNTTIEGPAFMQIEIPHPAVLAADKVANINGGNTGASDYKFVNPLLNQLFYDVGDITSWVQNWSVSCSTELSNMSKIKKTARITLKNIDSIEGQKFINAIENNLLTVSIDAGYVQGNLYPYFQGFITGTTYSRSGNDSTFTLECIDIASFVLENIYFDKNLLIAGMRHDLAIDSIMACSGFWSYYLRDNTDIQNGIINGIDLRLNSSSVNNQDLIKLNPLDKIYEKLSKLLERLKNPYSLPTFRWAERFGFVLECRNNYVDNDLRFTGLNSAGTAYIFNSNASNQTNFIANYQSDIHGLLVGEYNIKTNMKSLAAGVRVFGIAMTGFLADERYSPGSVSLTNLPVQTQVDLLGYLANAPFNPAQPIYVGFKKYINWSMQRNEIPDQQVLKRITDSVDLISRTPISSISFRCYVAKPLNFHGKFLINVFQGNTINATDQYIYESVDYNYDKDNNVITAEVSGINMPITLEGT